MKAKKIVKKTKVTIKVTKKQSKTIKKAVKTMVLQDQKPLDYDDDLRSIMNKSDFNKYELDAYLNNGNGYN